MLSLIRGIRNKIKKKENKKTEEIVIEVLRNFYILTYGMRKKIMNEGEEAGNIIQGIGMDANIEREFNKCTEIINALKIVLKDCLGVEMSTQEIEDALKELEGSE